MTNSPNPPNLTNLGNSPNLTNSQLTMDGREVPTPAPAERRLNDRQRDLMRYVRFRGGITTRDAGRFYTDAGGALRRLERLGLVRRTGRGGWEATP